MEIRTSASCFSRSCLVMLTSQAGIKRKTSTGSHRYGIAGLTSNSSTSSSGMRPCVAGLSKIVNGRGLPSSNRVTSPLLRSATKSLPCLTWKESSTSFVWALKVTAAGSCCAGKEAADRSARSRRRITFQCYRGDSMLDLRLIRTQPDAIRELVRRRKSPVDFDKLLAEDERVRALTIQLETLRSKR